jgi:outer membrane protein assembly factor BamE (lipoprotein component of BamABCDE complex)
LEETQVSFDNDSWKADANGCKKIRIGIYKEIIESQNEILGLTNKQIIRILGNPERNELYSRNQKFFIYQISPSPKCNNTNNIETLFLFIRFNAVGLSQEVFVQGTPRFIDKIST